MRGGKVFAAMLAMFSAGFAEEIVRKMALLRTE
jgi:hypothetical protein